VEEQAHILESLPPALFAASRTSTLCADRLFFQFRIAVRADELAESHGAAKNKGKGKNKNPDDRWYDGDIMMSRTQITLDHEMQRRVRRRASDLGVSLAEYFRRLVARDLARPEAASDVHLIFDLGGSGGSDIAGDKDEMIGEAVHSSRKKRP
jgi:hypothetical protein